MNQMTTFILVMAGLTILFYVMGIGSNPLVNSILEVATSPTSASTFALFVTIGTALVVGGGIIFGFVSRNAELQTMSVVAPIAFAFLWSFVSVIAKIMSYSPVIGILILSPIVILFWLTLPEYWRGRD